LNAFLHHSELCVFSNLWKFYILFIQLSETGSVYFVVSPTIGILPPNGKRDELFAPLCFVHFISMPNVKHEPLGKQTLPSKRALSK